MKAITSKKKVLDKLKKNNLIYNGTVFYLSDFHKTKVGNVVASKIISEGLVTTTRALSHWFEKEWKLVK